MSFDVNKWWAKTQFNDSVRVRVYRKLGTLLTNGVPMQRALESLYKKASKEGKKPTNPVAIILADWMKTVDEGERLSTALRPWVPHGEQMLVSSGEASGSIEDALASVCKGIKVRKRAKSAIQGAVIYPIILSFVTVGILWIFGTKVIPELARVSKPELWTGSAHSLYVMSGIAQNWTIPILGLIAVIAVMIGISMSRLTGPLRVYIDRIPPWSIYKMWTGGDFIISLSALQQAGTPLEKSMFELRANASKYVEERIDGAIRGLRAGLNLGEALERAGHQFPGQEVIEDISTYASLSGFDKALYVIANDWTEQGVENIEAQAKLMNGVSIMIMGVVIAWIASGLFAIQSQIANAVQPM